MLSLLPHEVFVLDALREMYSVEIEFKPNFVLLDKKNRYLIAISYVAKFKSKKCPFLGSNGLCMIHNVYKPLICRAYPITPMNVKYFIDIKKKVIVHNAPYGISMLCSKAKKIYEENIRRNTKDSIPTLFPDEYESLYTMEYIRSTYLQALSNLWRRNYIDVYRAFEFSNLDRIPLNIEFELINAFSIVQNLVLNSILISEDPQYAKTIYRAIILTTKSSKEKSDHLGETALIK